jgi:hypothetical protein
MLLPTVVFSLSHTHDLVTHYSVLAPEDLASKTNTPVKPPPRQTPSRLTWGTGAPGTPSGSSTTNPSSGSNTSTYVDTANLQGEELVGIHVERLNVEVVEGVGVYVAGAQYSIPRLKEHFGKDLCWPVVVSNKRAFSVTCCPYKGKPGHEFDGHMHQVDRDKKGDFIKTTRHFRLRRGDTGFREEQGNGRP